MRSTADTRPDAPVIVGAVQVVNRPGDGFQIRSATDLMIDAARRALDETGAAGRLGALTGEILVPHGTWPEADPGRAIAHAVGAAGARSVRSELGVSQYRLLARAATAVAQGAMPVALVVGGENRWSEVEAAKRGEPVPPPPEAATGSEPDEVLDYTDLPLAPVEIDRNLITAAHQYAIIESAFRHHTGASIHEHQRRLGELWERMASVAVRSPHAWNRQGMTAEEIAEPSPANRLIAAPYRKWMVSQWNVDQAVALVVTTVATARELGVPEDRWVFPLAVASSDTVVPMCERAEVHRWPAVRVAAEAVFRQAGASLDDVAAVDLYSCFPVAVEVQAAEIGLALDRPLTVTGGMTFAGGPFNNSSLQAVAAMVDLVRHAEPGTVGLTTAVSGFLTKPAVALWSASPGSQAFAAIDVSEAAAAATERRAVDPDLVGAAVVVGATVVPAADGGHEVIAVVESPDQLRTVVRSDDPDVAGRVLADDPVGWSVVVDAPGHFHLT